MSVTIDIQDWRALTQAVNQVKPFEGFFTQQVFKNKQNASADTIDWYVIEAVDKISKFVSEDDGSIGVGKAKRYIKSLKLPRIFEHKLFTIVEMKKFKDNQDGQLYVNSPEERSKQANMMILQELDDLKTRIYRRIEQMAASALSTGKITVSQDNIAFEYDFQFEADKHLITLAANAKWSATGVNPLKSIRAWKKQITKLTGLKADTLVLGSEAAEAFIANTAVMDALHTNNYKLGQIDLTSEVGLGATHIGNLLGLKIFEYDQDYTTDQGQVTAMLNPKSAILIATQSPDFRLYHGPIYRIENNEFKTYNVNELVKPKTMDDETAVKWAIESKPLPVVHEPNALVSAIVV